MFSRSSLFYCFLRIKNKKTAWYEDKILQSAENVDWVVQHMYLNWLDKRKTFKHQGRLSNFIYSSTMKSWKQSLDIPLRKYNLYLIYNSLILCNFLFSESSISYLSIKNVLYILFTLLSPTIFLHAIKIQNSHHVWQSYTHEVEFLGWKTN